MDKVWEYSVLFLLIGICLISFGSFELGRQIGQHEISSTMQWYYILGYLVDSENNHLKDQRIELWQSMFSVLAVDYTDEYGFFRLYVYNKKGKKLNLVLVTQDVICHIGVRTFTLRNEGYIWIGKVVVEKHG